jgi:hypothetical protein
VKLLNIGSERKFIENVSQEWGEFTLNADELYRIFIRSNIHILRNVKANKWEYSFDYVSIRPYSIGDTSLQNNSSKSRTC